MSSTTAPTTVRASRLRPYASLFLAPRGDGIRRRSGKDAVRLVAALLLTLILGLVAGGRHDYQSAITKAFHPPPNAVSWLITSLWLIASLGTILLLSALAALAKRFEVLRDFGVAAAGALLASVACQQLFGTSAGVKAEPGLDGVNLGFPVPILGMTVALALVALPYLSRTLQRLLEAVIAVAVLSGLLNGAGLPLSLLASVTIGWGAAALAHLIFGSPTGVPAAADVVALAAELGVEIKTLAPVPLQDWGVARFFGSTLGEEPVRVSLYGRDAQESQLFAKLGRGIAFKKSNIPFSLTRRQQLEHESYLTLLAAAAAPGGTPQLQSSGLAGPSKDALVVCIPPAATTLSQQRKQGGTLSDEQLTSIADVVRRIHADGLAHGAISLERIVVDDAGAGLIDFERATARATDGARHQDVAALLTCLGLIADAHRSVTICSSVLGASEVAAALPYLQTVALPTDLSTSLRKEHGKELLSELRKQGAAAASVEVPELAELRRMSWTTLVLTIGTLIGGWALIGVFLNVAKSFSTIANANWPWVVATAVLSQLAYIGSAFATLGSITVSVPLWPLIMLELSNTFSGLALGSAGTLAARVRFFQRQGMDTTIAVSSGVLESTASWIVKGGLFLIALPFAWSSLHFETLTKGSGSSGSSSESSLLTYLVLAIVAVGIGVAVMLAVPRWRKIVAAKIEPRYHEVRSHFGVLMGRPAKVAEIFGGMLVAQLVIAMALGTSLHAFGEQLSLPVILVVLTLGSMLGGISPVPGGMGVVEAGMILGLKAAGIPDDQAVAAVFVQRLFTAYLPPVAGWFALMWLRRKEYL